MTPHLIQSASEHLFFVYGPFQLSMVKQYVEHFSISSFRIFEVTATHIFHQGTEVRYEDVLLDALRNPETIVYIPQVNSIFANMLYSDKRVTLANLPDGLPNILRISPHWGLIAKQLFKKLYCAIRYRKAFTVFMDNLVGYGRSRFRFAFSPYPELIWDKSCPAVSIPLPWRTRYLEPRTGRVRRTAIVIGQPLEEIMSPKRKRELMMQLCEHAKLLTAVENVYYVLHPRERVDSLRLPTGIRVKRLSAPVEGLFARTYFDYCLGVSSFSLVNVKLLSKSTEVIYHLDQQLPYSSALRSVFNHVGMREI